MALTVAEFFCSFRCLPDKIFCSELNWTFLLCLLNYHTVLRSLNFPAPSLNHPCFVCWTIPILSLEYTCSVCWASVWWASVCWATPVLSVEPSLFCLLSLPLQHMSWTVLTFLVLPVLLSYSLNAGLYLFFTTLFYLLSCIGPCSFCYCPVMPAELSLFCLLNYFSYVC